MASQKPYLSLAKCCKPAVTSCQPKTTHTHTAGTAYIWLTLLSDLVLWHFTASGCLCLQRWINPAISKSPSLWVNCVFYFSLTNESSPCTGCLSIWSPTFKSHSVEARDFQGRRIQKSQMRLGGTPWCKAVWCKVERLSRSIYIFDTTTSFYLTACVHWCKFVGINTGQKKLVYLLI